MKGKKMKGFMVCENENLVKTKTEIKLGSLQSKLEEAKRRLDSAKEFKIKSYVAYEQAIGAYDRALASFKDANRAFIKEIEE
jgi:hypothetical protein